MNIFRTFILNLLEVSSFMIIWSAINKEKIDIKKNILIIILCSIMGSFFSKIKIPCAILGYIIIMFFICIPYKKKISELIVEFCICGFYITLMQILFTNLFCIILGYSFNYLNFGVSINLLILIETIIISLYLPLNKYYKNNKIYINTIIFYILNLFMYALFIKILWEYNRSIVLNNIFIFLIVFIVLSIINFFICKYILNIRKEEEKNNTYNYLLKDMIKDITNKEDKYENNLGKIFNDKIGKNELNKLLDKYIECLKEEEYVYQVIMKIEDKILAAVIYNKVKEAKKYNIDFKFFIKNDLKNYPFKENDFSDVINNILSEAFDKLKSLNIEKKQIILILYSKENKNYITVKNFRCSIKIDKVENGSLKNKINPNLRKIHKVKKIVESYNGKILLSFKGDTPCLKILF